MQAYAEDNINGLLNQINEWSSDKLDTVIITVQDLRLLKECYEESLEEIENLAFENRQMAEYLSCCGLTQQDIDKICEG